MPDRKDFPCHAGKLQGSPSGATRFCRKLQQLQPLLELSWLTGEIGETPTRYRQQQLQLVQAACNKHSQSVEPRRRDIFGAT